jgi:CRISPR-associated endoribonuclease Cas6
MGVGVAMPVRIAVTLEAESPGALPPPHTGPAIAAAFLRAVGQVHPEVATRLHDGPPPKPYALTPLLDEADRPPGRGSRRTRFEVGILVDELFASIYGALMTDATWRIGRTAYRRTATDVTAMAGYAELMGSAKPATSWGFRLVTPTGFSAAREEGARRQRVLPQPEWIFRSLFTRWQAFVDTPEAEMPESLVAAVEEHLEVIDCDLRVGEHMVKAGVSPVRGCVGTIRFALAEPDRVPDDARCALDALAAFAAFVGLGDRTTVGMGYACPLPAARPTRQLRSGSSASSKPEPSPEPASVNSGTS